jgi:putative endonuclease
MHTESYVYLLANKHNNVLYTGVTSDLIRRVYEQKSKLVQGFTKKYNVDRLVYYEACANIVVAIEREKQIKKPALSLSNGVDAKKEGGSD